jgi:hypothetical protein
MADERLFAEIPEILHSQFAGGILTTKILERLMSLVDQMNSQANQIDEWREHVIQRLRLPLLDQGVDPDGEYLIFRPHLTGTGNTNKAWTPKKRLPPIKKCFGKPLLAVFRGPQAS